MNFTPRIGGILPFATSTPYLTDNHKRTTPNNPRTNSETHETYHPTESYPTTVVPQSEPTTEKEPTTATECLNIYLQEYRNATTKEQKKTAVNKMINRINTAYIKIQAFATIIKSNYEKNKGDLAIAYLLASIIKDFRMRNNQYRVLIRNIFPSSAADVKWQEVLEQLFLDQEKKWMTITEGLVQSFTMLAEAILARPVFRKGDHLARRRIIIEQIKFACTQSQEDHSNNEINNQVRQWFQDALASPHYLENRVAFCQELMKCNPPEEWIQKLLSAPIAKQPISQPLNRPVSNASPINQLEQDAETKINNLFKPTTWGSDQMKLITLQVRSHNYMTDLKIARLFAAACRIYARQHQSNEKTQKLLKAFFSKTEQQALVLEDWRCRLQWFSGGTLTVTPSRDSIRNHLIISEGILRASKVLHGEQEMQKLIETILAEIRFACTGSAVFNANATPNELAEDYKKMLSSSIDLNNYVAFVNELLPYQPMEPWLSATLNGQSFQPDSLVAGKKATANHGDFWCESALDSGGMKRTREDSSGKSTIDAEYVALADFEFNSEYGSNFDFI